MFEPASLCEYLVTARVAIIPKDGAINSVRLSVLLSSMIPYFDGVARVEDEGPGVVSREGLVPQLGVRA